MKPTQHLNAAIGTFLLHVGLVVATVAGLSTDDELPASIPPLKVELIKPAPPAPMPVAQAQPTPPPPTQPPQPKKRQEPKPHITAEAKHSAPTRETLAAKPQGSEASGDSGRASATVAAPAPAAPPAPSAPVRTAPTDATYATSNRKPPYPRASQANHDEGTTVLRVLVKADGSAGEVQLKRSSGFPLLDESARSAVQAWRFTPATVDGEPVAEWYQVDVPFKLLNN